MPHSAFFRTFVAIILFVIVSSSCTRGNRSSDSEQLALYHKQQQTAHLTKNVALFLEMMSDTVVQVQKGSVKILAKEQMRERFARYFGAVEFIKWEDLAPPVYHIADDGSLASVIVQKRVELKVIGDTSAAVERTDFAWTELWRKEGGQWRMHTNISTEKTLP